MRKLLSSLALGAAVLAAAPASAVTVIETSAGNGNAAIPFGLTSSQISVDFDIRQTSPISLLFGVEQGDADAYNFDSLVSVFTGVGPQANGLRRLRLSLTDGATFTLGTVTPSFSVAGVQMNAAGNQVDMMFDPAENVAVELGSLDGTNGDFIINRGNIAPGGTFNLSVASAVPEPASWLMLITGFGLLGSVIRRRKAKAILLA